MEDRRETFAIERERVKDEFILKNCFEGEEQRVRTEDLVGATNKENGVRKRRSTRRKRPNDAEIAEKNAKIGSFFKKRPARAASRRKSARKEVIDCEEESSGVRIVEEIQVEDEAGRGKGEKAAKETPIRARKRNVQAPPVESYKPRELAILKTTPSASKRGKSRSRSRKKAPESNGGSKVFKLPKKAEFVWREKLFVITGKLQTTSERKDMESLLSFWGMIRRTSVSSRTDLLIHGKELEDGRSVEQSNKYKKASKFQSVRLVSEEALDRVFREFTGYSLQENFDKFHDDVDRYPGNLFWEEVDAEVEFELEEDMAIEGKPGSIFGSRRMIGGGPVLENGSSSVS